MTTSGDDLELRISNPTMRSFSGGHRHKPVFRPVHDQRRNLDLRKSIQVVGAKASPSMLATPQLPESNACAWLLGDVNDLVESLFDRDFRMVD